MIRMTKLESGRHHYGQVMVATRLKRECRVDVSEQEAINGSTMAEKRKKKHARRVGFGLGFG